MVQQVFYAFMAALFFSFLFNVPRRSVLVTASIAGIGYLVFMLSNTIIEADLTGYFLGTFVMAALSEIAARVMKMATTTFITIAVIPLVPGLGLYKTMQFVVQNDYTAAVQTGTHAMLAAGAIAMAIAVNTLIMKFILHLVNKKKPDDIS
ncbi:MAG: threonine/serine exporter family protein [Clostridia bacterium]|nr:threonine/serine exporter family protein [Clostridia bacterium]